MQILTLGEMQGAHGI